MDIISDPNEWKYHPKLDIVFVKKVSLLDASTIKKIKKLVAKVVGERFNYADSTDPIWIARKKKSKKQIFGICMLARKSPERHFDNETKTNVPYLYNMIVDVTDVASKTMKVSVSLLMRVKDHLSKNKDLWDWLESDKPRYINLNVECDNLHAIEFYEKNGFVAGAKLYIRGNMNNIMEYKIMVFNYSS